MRKGQLTRDYFRLRRHFLTKASTPKDYVRIEKQLNQLHTEVQYSFPNGELLHYEREIEQLLYEVSNCKNDNHWHTI